MGATEYCSGGVGKESSFARFLASFDFRLLQQYRHKCEAPTASRDVRVREKSGRHLLGLSISHFDPTETLATPTGNALNAGFRCINGPF